MARLNLTVTFIFVMICANSFAQHPPIIQDTNYYVSFPDIITIKAYGSQKYNSVTLRSISGKDLKYLDNKPLAFGGGFSYNNISINIAFPLAFLRDKDKGESKNIDFQGHLYSRKWMNDIYAQWFKGYYTDPDVYKDGSPYYYRPDIQTVFFGLARYRIFNWSRFSFRAAFRQHEWQKKSAGSLLAGAEIYYRRIRADSALVPVNLKPFYSSGDINRIETVTVSPGAGYAYTLVVDRHIFFTGSLTANLNLSYLNEKSFTTSNNRISVNPTLNFRIAGGYNGDKWSVSAIWNDLVLPVKGNNADNKYLFNTGNYRVFVARRFHTGKKWQKRLKPIDKIFKDTKDFIKDPIQAIQ